MSFNSPFVCADSVLLPAAVLRARRVDGSVVADSIKGASLIADDLIGEKFASFRSIWVSRRDDLSYFVEAQKITPEIAQARESYITEMLSFLDRFRNSGIRYYGFGTSVSLLYSTESDQVFVLELPK